MLWFSLKFSYSKDKDIFPRLDNLQQIKPLFRLALAQLYDWWCSIDDHHFSDIKLSCFGDQFHNITLIMFNPANYRVRKVHKVHNIWKNSNFFTCFFLYIICRVKAGDVIGANLKISSHLIDCQDIYIYYRWWGTAQPENLRGRGTSAG